MANVVFLCVQNAGRSQMAAGFAQRLGGDALHVTSGGSAPASMVHASVVAAMAEVGIDVSEAQPRRWTDDDLHRADVVVTMGCGDECPVVPGTRYEDWPVDDPSGQPPAVVRAIRDDVRGRVEALLLELGITPREVSA